MTITLRGTKGFRLTHAELDANFTDLQDSANLDFIQSGTGAAARTLQAKERDIFSVKDFGAVGDGVTNDSAAILAAVNAAAGQSVGADNSTQGVYFPPGIYRIGTSACLTPTIATSIAAGIHFFGAGMYTSILRLNPSGSDLYFYNNVATPRAQFCSFADLAFEGVAPANLSAYTDISDNAKGFRLWATSATGSHEQGFRFTRCRMFGLHTMFETDGDQTTSENSFTQCKISHIKTTVFSTVNLQSLNHTFTGTDIEVIYGDVFSISGNGGGAIKMYGGSVILLSDKASDVFFFKQTVAGTGTTAFPLTFNGVRFEFRGNTTNAVSLADLANSDVRFNDCSFITTATSDLASFCKVGRSGRVLFRGCSFTEQSTGLFQFHIISATRVLESGSIYFDDCGVPIDWSDRCTLDNRYGHISANGCFGTNVGAISTPRHFAHDFEARADETAGVATAWDSADGTGRKDGNNGTSKGWRLKTYQIKLGGEFWPDTTEHGLRLPRNAIIKNIHLRKPSGGSDATSTIFRVGRADKSGTDHLVSDTQRMDAAHTGDTTNYFYCVGTTDNERNILLYTDEAPAINLVGGLCFVEYY